MKWARNMTYFSRALRFFLFVFLFSTQNLWAVRNCGLSLAQVEGPNKVLVQIGTEHFTEDSLSRIPAGIHQVRFNVTQPGAAAELPKLELFDPLKSYPVEVSNFQAFAIQSAGNAAALKSSGIEVPELSRIDKDLFEEAQLNPGSNRARISSPYLEVKTSGLLRTKKSVIEPALSETRKVDLFNEDGSSNSAFLNEANLLVDLEQMIKERTRSSAAFLGFTLHIAADNPNEFITPHEIDFANRAYQHIGTTRTSIPRQQWFRIVKSIPNPKDPQNPTVLEYYPYDVMSD